MNNEQEGKVLKRADQVKEQEKNGFVSGSVVPLEMFYVV